MAETASARVTGYGISYAITSILSALLVVLKESNESVLNLMVSLTGHHWITHGLLDVILFVALGALLSSRNITMSGNTLISTVVGSTILSGLIIAGFFLQ
ncbi:MAG: hypothetical protein GXP11_03385 [Gammaproteobacteria bacterium]|nr:hypothetical protein [Gammaproteobacteria bacterium]